LGRKTDDLRVLEPFHLKLMKRKTETPVNIGYSEKMVTKLVCVWIKTRFKVSTNTYQKLVKGAVIKEH